MILDARTRLAALLGYPVEHSLSPLIHNTAFRTLGLNRVYVAFSVPPEGLRAAVEGLEALGAVGSNVTIPHKQAVFSLADELSEAARITGAVNTLVFDRSPSGSLRRGDNTDVAGFLEPLGSLPLAGVEMLVFGAGGSARAVVYALLKMFHPSRLTIAARDPHKAALLAESLAAFDSRSALRVVPFAEAAPAVRSARLLVNTTPLGMHPHPEGSPWENASDFGPGQFVYDLIYNPRETRLLCDAASRGAVPIGGLAMLAAQAAASFIQWTGLPMPTDAVYEAIGAVRS